MPLWHGSAEGPGGRSKPRPPGAYRPLDDNLASAALS